MVASGFVGDAVAFLVWIFRSAAAACKMKPELLDNRETGRVDRIARIGERDRLGYPVEGALRVDGFYLLSRPARSAFDAPLLFLVWLPFRNHHGAARRSAPMSGNPLCWSGT